MQSALWVGKKLFSGHLRILPECVWCGGMGESISHYFFRCPVVWPLCRHLEGFNVYVLNWKSFVQETSSVCRNVVLSLNRTEHYVFLCVLGIMRVVIWTTRRKRIFLVSDIDGFLKAPNQNPVWEIKTLFFGVWQKGGQCCTHEPRERYLPRKHFGTISLKWVWILGKINGNPSLVNNTMFLPLFWFGWLFGSYGVSAFVGYLTPNPILEK